MDPIPEDVQRRLERLVEEDLKHATVISSTVHVDAAGRISLEEIILRRQDRREVSIGLAGVRPESTRTEPAITMDVYDGPGVRRPWSMQGWREMSIERDYAEELADETRVWRPEPEPGL
ncbi:hypothetical protein [Methanoculleus sp.]|uniref:hypothetical protein n=1 Tax=Methanoculleus sp. TaxID=90427 RepID=UPI001BD2BD64|nr:hypothetical protein [Methanoculleus sp.]